MRVGVGRWRWVVGGRRREGTWEMGVVGGEGVVGGGGKLTCQVIETDSLGKARARQVLPPGDQSPAFLLCRNIRGRHSWVVKALDSAPAQS